MLHTEKDLNELLICKEQELKELQACQIHFLKTTLQETQKQLQEMQRKFNRLKEDFTYNLKVLDERDRELQHYDNLLTQLKIVENAKEAEVSELKIQVDKLQQALNKETKKQEALQYQYQQQLKEHQLGLERLLSSKDSDLNHHHEEYENMKQQLERKLQEVEGELALQRQELLVEFDAAIKKREHEFRQKADEMSNLCLSHELKVKLLTRELEALKDAGMKAAESMKEAEAANLQLEKEVKRKDWEIKDLVAVKDAQIQVLERKLDSLQLSWKKEREIFERKHAAVDRFSREKDARFSSMKEAHVEQMHKWENQIRELQINKETLEMELHRAEWRYTDCLREKETAVEKLEQELQAQQSSWDSRVAQISKETISKDLQIQVLQEEEVKLRAQVTSLLQDIERYKQQLLLASERETALERAKVQIELDWRRHSENAERDQYQKSEALIQSLSTARDQATAELQKKEQKLHEVEAVLSSVTHERDQAVGVLKKCGLLPEIKKQVTLQDNIGATEAGFLSPEVQRLQEQNNNLRAVIAEMRREMETLDNQESSSGYTKIKAQDTDRTDYVLFLEEEVRKLKNKCWAMNKQLENASEIPSKLFAASLNAPRCNKNTQTSCEDHSSKRNSDALHPDEITEDSLKKHEGTAPCVDLTGTQMNAVTRRLQGDPAHFKQWFFGMGAGDGPHPHKGNNGQAMLRKLKEAVRKISNLSKEKQQLIEMVNRLRAELGAASMDGSHDFKHSNQTPGHIFLDVLHPRELARETEHLLALEHLQYQLTTQELQYALRKHNSGKCPVGNFNNENVPSDSKGAELTMEQVQSATFVMNNTAGLRQNEISAPHQDQQLRKGSPSQSKQGQLSSPGSSLQDIWQILEMGSSPSILSPQSNKDQKEYQGLHGNEKPEDSEEKGSIYLEKTPAAALTVTGNKLNVQSKQKPNKPSYCQPRKPWISQQTNRIRNYNVKD
ncbi:coiled-coil domain-containing protein 57 isoform X3 [Sphaerodactylus townsendi]|nr:coiled-coil domain-containing protein 57 isoform X3 [Sphaerodactylus townsendi]XP_048344242.1 coiled-coil domain-containing protein 57 isoform X3 [Sphaerodactylus townsendi]